MVPDSDCLGAGARGAGGAAAELGCPGILGAGIPTMVPEKGRFAADPAGEAEEVDAGACEEFARAEGDARGEIPPKIVCEPMGAAVRRRVPHWVQMFAWGAAEAPQFWQLAMLRNRVPNCSSKVQALHPRSDQLCTIPRTGYVGKCRHLDRVCRQFGRRSGGDLYKTETRFFDLVPWRR